MRANRNAVGRMAEPKQKPIRRGPHGTIHEDPTPFTPPKK